MIAAARYAVEALDEAANVLTWGGFKTAADELREALAAAPEQAEPVAWRIDFDGRYTLHGHNAIADYRAFDPKATSTPLYASPQAPAAPIAQPLTDTVPVPTIMAWSGGPAPYRFLLVRLDDTPTEHEYVPAAQPLTDEQIAAIFTDINVNGHNRSHWWHQFARAIERVHGIGAQEQPR